MGTKNTKGKETATNQRVTTFKTHKWKPSTAFNQWGWTWLCSFSLISNITHVLTLASGMGLIFRKAIGKTDLYKDLGSIH